MKHTHPFSAWRRLLNAVGHYPVTFLMILAGITLLAAFGLPRLSLQTDYTALTARDVRSTQAYLQTIREFGSDNRTFLYLRVAHFWTPAKLTALAQLHDRLLKLAFVERVDDLFTSPSVHAVDGKLYGSPLVDKLPVDEQGAEGIRQLALDSPIAKRNLVSTDGQSLAIGVAMREAADPGDEEKRYAELEKLLDASRTELPSLVQIGPQRIQAEIRNRFPEDALRLSALSAVAMAVFIALFSRHLFLVLTFLAAGCTSLIWAFGALGWFGIPLNLLSAAIPSLVFAFSGGKIILATVRQPTVRQPTVVGAADAPGDAGNLDSLAKIVGDTSLLTVLILLAGFVGQLFTGVDLCGHFGLGVALTLLANRVTTICFLPLFHRWFPPLATTSKNTPPKVETNWFTAPLQRLIRCRGITIVILTITMLFGSLAVLNGLPKSSRYDPIFFFKADHPIHQASKVMHEELAGANLLYITVNSNSEGAFRNPANLQRLFDIQSFLSKQKIVDSSLSLADLLASANRESAGGREDAYHVPPNRSLVGQYLMLYRPRDLEPYVSHDFKRANIVVRFNFRDSAALHQDIQEIRSAISHYAGPNMTTQVIGRSLLINDASEHLLGIETIVITAGLVLLLLAFTMNYTTAKGGLAAFLLTTQSLLLFLAISRLLGIDLGLATVVALLFSIAVSVQITNRLFRRYSELSRHEPTYERAALLAVQTVAPPALAACLGLCAGFSMLSFSGYAQLQQMGLQTGLSVGITCVLCILLAPPMLRHVRLVELYDLLALSTQSDALRESALFSGFSSYEIRKTILLSELDEYQEGDYLIRQESIGRSMFVVVSGQVEILLQGGRRITELHPGDVFGEIGFVNETRRTADVRALGPVSVLRFDHDRLKKDLLLFPFIMSKLNFNICGILGQRLAEMNRAAQ